MAELEGRWTALWAPWPPGECGRCSGNLLFRTDADPLELDALWWAATCRTCSTVTSGRVTRAELVNDPGLIRRALRMARV